MEGPAPVALSKRVEVADARVHGSLHAYGTADDKAAALALALAPGDRLELVGERPDGGCVYRLQEGLVTMPCLAADVAQVQAPAVRWRASTPLGTSGWIDVADGFRPDPASLWSSP